MNLAIRLVICSTLAVLTLPRNADCTPIQPGDILVSNQDAQAIYKVNRNTGNRELFSINNLASGAACQAPKAIAFEPSGHLLVLNVDYKSFRLEVQRIDRNTGFRTLVSSSSRGTGPELYGPEAIAVGLDGMIYVAQGNFQSTAGVLKIDPVTGNRSAALVHPSSYPTAMTIAPTGNIIVGDIALRALYSVAPPTNERTFLNETELVRYHFNDLAVGPNGIIYGTDQGKARVVSFDPQTKTLTTVSGDGFGSGPTFPGMPWGIEIDSNGQLIVVCNGTGSVNTLFRIDPLTGSRSILSGAGVGTGTAFQDAEYVAIAVPVPEPAAIISSFVCVLMLISLCAIKSSRTGCRL